MKPILQVLTIFVIKLVDAKWLPELDFQPNFDQFQIYKSHLFQNIIFPSSDGKLPKQFEWQTVSSVTLSSINVSYIVYGGSQQVDKESKSAFSKQKSSVILCELKSSRDSSVFEDINCSFLKADENDLLLGASLKGLSLSSEEAVVVYCDPLWSMRNTSETKPSGKCYLLLLNDRKERKGKSIEFCKLSQTSYGTCMGGFSVDLISLNNRVSGIEMIIGLPHMVPYGGVQLVNDPFGAMTISNPRNGAGNYYNYGYAVSMTNNGVGYASSPLSDQYGPNVTNIRQDIKLTSPDNVPFSSFGLSLITLSISQGQKHAVVIGAPFHSKKAVQNVGKAYIFCSSINNQSYISESIYGQEKDEFLGYSIANIGDINGDGNDDVAISSPFLRDDDARGFITLYTVNENCMVSKTPHQILRTQQGTKLGIFGIAVAGGSDMDFNSWPDIIVSNTKSNSIEMFASRLRYRAQCTFQSNNNYETQPLSKGEIIVIKIYLSILDTKRNNFVNMDFFKNLNLASQVDPNFNVSINRFELHENQIGIKFHSPSNVEVDFSVKSLQHVRDMNLSSPVIVAYRFVEDCKTKDCNNLLFPLIDWRKCTTKIPIGKYICSSEPICNADIAIELQDTNGNEVLFGYDRNYHRTLEMKIYNYGPTEAKDVNFRITTFQNLRINKITALEDVNINDIISINQTTAVCKFDQFELDVTIPSVKVLTVMIDLYFIDSNEVNKMNYENNSIVIELYSDVVDANLTNNIAKIDYVFIYEPNISYSGSTKQDTVVDTRNRSQLVRPGQRITIDTIGPRLSQTYVIDNLGKGALINMSVTISLPMKTDKFNILYLFDKIRGVNKSQVTWMSIVPNVIVGTIKYPCYMPSMETNPLSIIGFETHESHLTDMERTVMDGSVHVIKKRSVDQSSNSVPSNKEKDIKMTQGKMHRIPVEIIQCNRPGVNLDSPTCADIHCKIPLLPANKQARIQINAWLWAFTFFKKQISDIMIYTTLKTSFDELPQGVKLKSPKDKPFSQFQQFIFKNVKPKIVHIKPLWPIIVGVVIGILILAILIVAMYKCGFFKRSKRRRHFRSKKSKRNDHVILHPYDIQPTSTISSETKFTSHSALINNKD